MRAMAHPARLALLEHLRNGGPATATECAGVVGLSPSATSYHLRALARAGLVEAAPGRGDGRERLWRIIAGRRGITGVADLPPEGREALRALLESLLAWDDTRFRRYLSRLDAEPPEWQDAAFFMDSTLQVTAAELTALGQALEALVAPYRKDRRADVPAGTRPVSLTFRALPS
jgi:DNA-binding transcriptional ArsR family regulator